MKNINRFMSGEPTILLQITNDSRRIKWKTAYPVLVQFTPNNSSICSSEVKTYDCFKTTVTTKLNQIFKNYNKVKDCYSNISTNCTDEKFICYGKVLFLLL